MTRYKTKSVIIGRKKRKDRTRDDHPCFITLFGMNNPHKTGAVPDKILDFEDIHKVELKGFDINYLLAGNDLVINNLEYIEIEHDKGHLFVSGKQN